MKYVVAIRAMCSFLFESLIRLGYKSDVRRSALFNSARRCSKWNFPSAHFASAPIFMWAFVTRDGGNEIMQGLYNENKVVLLKFSFI